MKPIIFTGSGVAIVTPMNPDSSINYEQLGALIDWHIEQGTDSIVTCGTTGESSTMTDEEHIEVMRYTVEHAAGRVPIVAGCGSNDTSYAIWLSQKAKEIGADALLHVTPYYNKTSQRGLVAHFNAIADATDLPVILYNVPSRTGLDIKPETYLELSKHPNIVATKEASGNISAIAKTVALCGDELSLYSGNDDQIIPLMSLGGKGVISVLANVAPQLAHEIPALYLAGEPELAAQKQLNCIDLCDALFCDVNPIPVKEAMNMMGLAAGPCRLPLYSTDEAHHNQIRTALQTHGLV